MSEQRRRKRHSEHPIRTADSICRDSYVLTSDSVSHFFPLDPSLLSHCFSLLLFALALSLSPPPCPSSSLSPPRSSPLHAPERNEPPLLSGTLFLWQCEQASKSAGSCSANVWGQIPHSGSPLTSVSLCQQPPQAALQLLLQRALWRPNVQRVKQKKCLFAA